MISDIFSGLFAVVVAVIAAFITFNYLLPVGAQVLETGLNPLVRVIATLGVFGATVTKFSK